MHGNALVFTEKKKVVISGLRYEIPPIALRVSFQPTSPYTPTMSSLDVHLDRKSMFLAKVDGFSMSRKKALALTVGQNTVPVDV